MGNMNTTFYEHNSRYDYPFISSDGNVCRVFTDAVDDMVLWIDDISVMPIWASAQLSDNTLMLEFSAASGEILAYASEMGQAITTTSGSLCGYVIWNDKGRVVLKSSLEANNPQPYSAMYVSPSACILNNVSKLNTITVNGQDDGSSLVIIDSNDIYIRTTENPKNGTEINIYSDEYGNTQPITSIVFEAHDPANTVKFDNLNKHVWLLSDAECDIRVVTGDSILVTEASNDRI